MSNDSTGFRDSNALVKSISTPFECMGEGVQRNDGP